jgi:hypothetical protein
MRNAKCEFRISQSEIRNPQFSNDSHSHRELLGGAGKFYGLRGYLRKTLAQKVLAPWRR